MNNLSLDEKYKEKGFHSFSSAWSVLKDAEKSHVFSLAEEYKQFLDKGKIERECVEQIVATA